MSKSIPSIQKYMTTSPHSIGPEQTLQKAHELMDQHGIRHLPVLRGGQLVGILSERDLNLVESLRGVDPTTLLVADAMSESVYAVPPDAPIDEVVDEMARHKYGSAIVIQTRMTLLAVTRTASRRSRRSERSTGRRSAVAGCP